MTPPVQESRWDKMRGWFWSLLRWLGAALLALFHWFLFGVIISLVPYVVFVNTTEEGYVDGFQRLVLEAALRGEIYMMMIPLVGALIGETVSRNFVFTWLESIAALAGIVLLVLLVGAAYDAKEPLPTEAHALDERNANVLRATQELPVYKVVFGTVVMVTSAMRRAQ
ncbi:MAG: hypothetical protein AAF677_00905 [Pseudomonadota bacterium]